MGIQSEHITQSTVAMMRHEGGQSAKHPFSELSLVFSPSLIFTLFLFQSVYKHSRRAIPTTRGVGATRTTHARTMPLQPNNAHRTWRQSGHKDRRPFWADVSSESPVTSRSDPPRKKNKSKLW